MFDLHDRLQTLARSLERVYVEELGNEERFFYANPDGSSTLFLTLRDDTDTVYGIRLEDGLACSALPLRPHIGGWTEVVNPTDVEEEALWQAVLASYQAARRPLARPTGFSLLGVGESAAPRFAPHA